MRIVAKYEIGKLVTLLRGNEKGHIAGFKQSELYPDYMFWNAAGNEQSEMYQTVYATPALLAEAQELLNAEQSTAL